MDFAHTPILSEACNKTQLSQSHITQQGVSCMYSCGRPQRERYSRLFVYPDMTDLQSKIYRHLNCRQMYVDKNYVSKPLLMHQRIISIMAVKHLGWIPKVSHRKINMLPPVIL